MKNNRNGLKTVLRKNIIKEIENDEMRIIQRIIALCLLLSFVLGSCQRIKPKHQEDNALESLIHDSITGVYASDTVEIRELQPTDSVDGNPIYNDVVGSHIITTLKTDSDDIYISYNIKLLELHPDITKDLITYIHYELRHWCFIPGTDTIATYNVDTMKTQRGAILKEIGCNRKAFHKQLNEILEDGFLGYNITFEIYPVFLTPDFVTYYVYRYAYTGGAHGNYDWYYTTYNRTTGKTLAYEDIIKEDKDSRIHVLLARHLAAKFEYHSVKEYIDSLNAWKNRLANYWYYNMPSTQTIGITVRTFPTVTPGLINEGLIFTYPRYSIASGICGVPCVVLSYGEVEGSIKVNPKEY